MSVDAGQEQGSLDTSNIDVKRRRFVTAAASVVGGVGVVALATPFVATMLPSARARAAGAPVEADISKLEPGQMMIYEWRGKPVWIVRRTDEALENLTTIEGDILDPNSDNTAQQPGYAKNEYRSLKPEIMVMVGVCTHLGCSPTYRPDIAPADLGGDWKGGFFCPCHGSKFDLAGRVYKGVPAPKNLEVPPYKYLSDTRIVIGENPEEAAA